MLFFLALAHCRASVMMAMNVFLDAGRSLCFLCSWTGICLERVELAMPLLSAVHCELVHFLSFCRISKCTGRRFRFHCNDTRFLQVKNHSPRNE